MTITNTDIKNASIVIESLNNIDKTEIENSSIAITHFDFILSKYKKAYESKDKLTLAKMKFITTKTKTNKKGKKTVFVDKYLLPQKRMSDLMVYASASASDRKKALSLNESLQVTANNIKKFQAERSKKSEEKELKNNPIKKAEALREAFEKQKKKIENAFLVLYDIVKADENNIFTLENRITENLYFHVISRNCLNIKSIEMKAYHEEQERIKKERLEKAKTNKNLNQSLSKNGLNIETANSRKIVQNRKEIENFNKQASAS